MNNEETAESGLHRPDPAFKEYTAEQARLAGLELRNVELPQLSSTDLVLAVPDNTDLTGTMFDFFGKVNLVEFKSEGDTFGLRELAYNQARAWLMFAKGEVDELNELMSVFVVAQRPQKVLEFLQQTATNYRAEQEWLLRGWMSGIEVAIVVCRLLPIERRYYYWLIFAPATSKKWQNFVTMLLEEGEFEMLRIVARLKPREVSAMTLQANKRIKKGSKPSEMAQAVVMLHQYLLEDSKDDPARHAEILQMGLDFLYPEELAARLTPEQRLAGLGPEQLAATLTPEQLTGLEPAQRLAGLEPAQIAAELTPEERKKLLELLLQQENQES